MKIILYLSVALIAVAFFVLVIYLSKTLKSLQKTLESVSKTLVGLEGQLDGVTRETTVLLHKTNTLADDIQRKSESLNTVVDAVKDVGKAVNKFNHSIQNITNTVDRQIEQNKEKISQVMQWSNVFLELKDKWKSKKEKTYTVPEHELMARESQRERVRSR
ncbi:DUF948 domain-containing protein [Neobacillus sp. PS3-34]|uniref:DUF948 domain-containing protein n=1 Tax=Neobacillus sp. PS3-34 TaxID=3070678 RepID=UPI0027E07BD4|nr:DUF948 domain-containing protein [Neobacillus sp. PS3-34]WML47274.1 DUF948 domain-containing protein [Neobacillus sp. PS3-34]